MILTNTDFYTTDIKFLKGVGPTRAKILEKLKIKNFFDLLFYPPRIWEDRRFFKTINQLKENEIVLVKGKVEGKGITYLGRNLAIFKVALSDLTGVVYGCWYKKINYRFDVFKKLKSEINKGDIIVVYGRTKFKHIDVEYYEKDNTNSIHIKKIVPIYNLTKGINELQMREFVYRCIKLANNKIIEFLPDSLLKRFNLPKISWAISNFHFPKSFNELKKARMRLTFDESLLLQIALKISHDSTKSKEKDFKYELKKNLLTPFRQNLGFEFTKSQKIAINEIFKDMYSKYPMNRLLHGEVGSGKTVVVLAAMLLACENGYQSVMIAPTEILAEQHYFTIKTFLKNLPVNVALLTGGLDTENKKQLLEKIPNGEYQIVIGTHALLEKELKFKNLSLVVIDEQHRFGVQQRLSLIRKGYYPDVLFTTATPIPRSLALTLYGNLDISTINEVPFKNKSVKTIFISEKEAFEIIKKEIEKGYQVFIVYPIIEQTDEEKNRSKNLKALITEFERLKKIFPFEICLLHGKMSVKDKERIMTDFKNKKYQILLSTTVIEVGIDIPNANVILIQHCEMYGLATLHQLRGRIGRSNIPSYCLLTGNLQTPQSKARIDAVINSNDGFKIAEEDLKIRGPGEFFGTEQHGYFDLKFLDLQKDLSTILETKKIAKFLVEKNRKWLINENNPLWNEVKFRFQDRFIFPIC